MKMERPKYKYNHKQQEALRLIHGPARNVMLYGGARSAKTFTVMSEKVGVAIQFPRSRQLAARLRWKHIKASVWNDTLKKILRQYDARIYELNASDLVVRFMNGSEILFGGLDTEERAEKILGQEFCRIYLNECTQIPYKVVTKFKKALLILHFLSIY